jgi:glyoxylase I family protein|tara:strand:- start:1895 stop:2398 length:504 start_codon:yes stop_codon:yes gene_type:complete
MENYFSKYFELVPSYILNRLQFKDKFMATNAPFKMKGIDHVVLRIKNLQLMKNFYCNVLGCTIENEDDNIGLYQVRAGAQLIDFVPVDQMLGSIGGPPPGKDGHNMDHFAIQIEPYDDDAIRKYLLEHGVDLGETIIRSGAEGEGFGIQIKDPEGNTVELKGPSIVN